MNENRFYVYALLDPRKHGQFTYGEYSFEYEPIYVGKGTGDRILKHLRKSNMKRQDNTYLNGKISHIQALGLSPIKLKIQENIKEDEAFALEIRLVNTIGRKCQNGPLTNLDEGGFGSSKSEETKKKISETKKQQYKSGEVIHPLLGTKWTESQRTKRSATAVANPVKWNNEQKAKLAAVRRQNKNKTQTMHWKLTSPQGETYVVYGLGEFCRNNNLSQSHLFQVHKGNRKHHKGWKCERL